MLTSLMKGVRFYYFIFLKQKTSLNYYQYKMEFEILFVNCQDLTPFYAYVCKSAPTVLAYPPSRRRRNMPEDPKEISKDDSALIIQQIIMLAEASRTNNALGRYQGWALIFQGACYNWINEDYQRAKSELDSQNVKLNRWSSISQDQDDNNDFGVKLTKRC